MTQDAKPLTADDIEVVRRHVGCNEYCCEISKPRECEVADEHGSLKALLATIDQQAAEIERLRDLAYSLWAVICNVDSGNWHQTEQWHKAVGHVRGEYFEITGTCTQPCPNVEPCAEHPRVSPAPQPSNDDRALRLAQRFHDVYEELAPQFGYETRIETRKFDAESANGRLMIAVCRVVLHEFVDVVAKAEQ